MVYTQREIKSIFKLQEYGNSEKIIYYNSIIKRKDIDLNQ